MSFDTCVSSIARSNLERAFDVLRPNLAECIISPLTGVVTPRCHISCGETHNGVNLSGMVQGFSMFYNGVLPESRHTDIRTAFGIVLPRYAQFQLRWSDLLQETFKPDRFMAVSWTLYIRLDLYALLFYAGHHPLDIVNLVPSHRALRIRSGAVCTYCST